MFEYIFIPKSLLLRGAIRTVESDHAKTMLEHSVEFSVARILLLAVSLWANFFPVTRLESLNAL